MSKYYDRDGSEITLNEWTAKRRQTEEYRRVAYTEVDGIGVSTVWLGLDHSFGHGPPLIFETVVFGSPMDGEMDRYTTEAEALAGHDAMVKRVQLARWGHVRQGRGAVMARLSLHHHVNGVAVHHDSGRQTVTLVAWPLSVTFKADEARQLHDELRAALAGLAVKDSALAEVSEA